MLVCPDRNEAVEILSSPRSGKLFTARAKETKQRIIFMFPGQGSQYVNMGLGLYSSEPVFRQCMDQCFDIFKSVNGYDIKEILYPTHPAPSGHPSQEGNVDGRGGSLCPPSDDQPAAAFSSNPQLATSTEKINQTEISQPVIFMFEYALAKLLMSWGIQPEVMIGYSFGEYTAACLSGVVSLEDAVRLVALRGRLMQQMPQGAMLSVPLPAVELKPLLKDKLSIAIDNGPSCIVSGTSDEINELDQLMKEKKYLCIRVSVSHAGHSTVMGPILSEFEEELRAVELKEPQIPYISNLTAASITGIETMDPGYWIRHLKDTVRFAEGIAELFTIPNSIFVEIGPGRDLCVLLKGHQDCKPEHRMINLVRHEKEEVPDLYYLLNRIGHLWLYGVDIDWQQFYADEKKYRIPLPTYNFQRQRFAIEPAPLTGQPGKQSQDMLQNKTNIDDWIYIPLWKRSRISSFAEIFLESNQMGILLFIDESGWGHNIQTRLEQEGYQVSLVRMGKTYARLNEYEYCAHPAETGDYEALFNELKASGKLTSSYTILHLWGIKPLEKENPGVEEVAREQEKGFFSLIAVAKALGKQDFANHFQVKVAANNVLDVIGGEVICPGKATLLGPVKVIGHEYDNINCCLIDLVLPEPGSTEEQLLVNQLLEEFKIKIQDKVIAYRNNHRWVQTVEPVELQKPVTPGAGLREKGVYLVTGGVGGMGLSLAEHLARSVKAKLILTARSTFPAQEDWDHWLLNHDPDDKISGRIGKIREIEALGAEVQVFSADVTNIQHMELMISRAQKRFGPINGVIHAAGVPDGAMIIRRTREMSEKVLAPKITGTLCLYQLFQDMSLDFMVFYSSLASILPLPGQTAYAAANAFLDAFAASHVLKNGVFPVSINWDRWKSTGISVIAEEHHKKLWGEEMKSVITPSEGLEIFSRILSDPISPQVLVSPIDLKLGMQHYNTSKSLFPVHKYTNNSSPKIIHLRPELSVPYVEPGNETERKLAEVWQTFLGIDRVGILDNFFELGATSLGILQVNGRLQNVLGKDIPVVAMYSYPTTALLSKFIDHKSKDGEFFAKEEYAFETRDKGQEKMKELRARKRNAPNG
jgi:malonyl CoA-acyl carrier protein transacylase/acyl carrier protein